MQRKSGKYALVQFCPVSERLEFLNIGVVLAVPDLAYVGVRFARDNARIDRVFGKQPHAFVDAWKESFEVRLRSEFSGDCDDQRIPAFASKRANGMRISPVLPIMVEDPDIELERLFAELVDIEAPDAREPRIRSKLRKAFADHGVAHYLDKPDTISLPEFDIKITAPFGYRNGSYNLIDGVRVTENVADRMREVGKKAFEGRLLWRHFENADVRRRLVVVGDFARISNGFFHAVSVEMEDANVKLYRLDDMRPLLEDIEANAALHC